MPAAAPRARGLELTHVSDLPGRTGLGTSSAFTVALLHALHERRGDRVGPEDLAREAIEVERERGEFGVAPTGCQRPHELRQE